MPATPATATITAKANRSPASLMINVGLRHQADSHRWFSWFRWTRAGAGDRACPPCKAYARPV